MSTERKSIGSKSEANTGAGTSGTLSSPPAEPGSDDARTARTRELNDRLRKQSRGGVIHISIGIAALGPKLVNAIFEAIAAFDHFTPDNDPWGEHDCASLTVNGLKILWKIDYYDRQRQFLSPDPSDPKLTVRVLTVMRADEY